MELGPDTMTCGYAPNYHPESSIEPHLYIDLVNFGTILCSDWSLLLLSLEWGGVVVQ